MKLVSLAATLVATLSLPAAAAAPVPCSELRTMRELAPHVRLATNPRTGHAIEYLVMGDGARSDRVIVFFNGTSQILPDWPTQLVSNARWSPRIRTTATFRWAQENASSLCHAYRLVFFDYPGVGASATNPTGVTSDQIASDVSAMLDEVASLYGISTSHVSLVGWSLGTEMALKFAFLSPRARPDRTIHDVVLIASKPGGGQNAQTNGNGAQCIQYPYELLKNPDLSPVLRERLEANNIRLLYPFVGQEPYDLPSIDCIVTVSGNDVSANVAYMPCGRGTLCRDINDTMAANRLSEPWVRTRGVSFAAFVNQRNQAYDWQYAYCPSANSDFQSLGCTESEAPALSATGGGVCKTYSPAKPAFPVDLPDEPVAIDCVPLAIAGSITLINGPEDLYIQHVYGRALVKGYQRAYGVQKATLVTYPGPEGAGHGIVFQHTGWTQRQVWHALAN